MITMNRETVVKYLRDAVRRHRRAGLASFDRVGTAMILPQTQNIAPFGRITNRINTREKER